MRGRPGAARAGAAKPGALRGAAGGAGKPEGGWTESLVGKKRRDGDTDARDGEGEGELDGDVDGETKHGSATSERAEVDWLDPSARRAAQLAPPGLATGAVDAANAANANEPLRARSLEELIPALVRRIAWAGDRNKGTVRLELGAGAYAGTTVTVHADGGRVRVEIGGSEGPELERLRTRLDARLRGHGLDVESVT
ncbi:MAG: hypothetical protein JWO86_1273 [Myxococcaceae bacterium]|nr:hypothetical protein [Myxococcaceae bacterium]